MNGGRPSIDPNRRYDLLAQPQLGYAQCVVHIHRRNEQRDSRNVNMRTGQRRTRQHGQDVAHRIVPDAQCRSNFGVLISAFAGGDGTYALYSRVQTPEGNGFSIEGTVANTCCGTVSEVIGLVRQAAAPTFQSNCFIFNQEPRAGRIVLTLASGDGQVVASQIVDVKAMEFIRLLDVFAALNAPTGDVDNVRATFESIVLWRVEPPSCSLRPARSRTTRRSMPIFASPSSTSDASDGQFVTRPPPESCQSVSATRADRCRAPIHRSRRRQP